MQSLFFSCMKERDKRGSARRVVSTQPQLEIIEECTLVEIKIDHYTHEFFSKTNENNNKKRTKKRA